MTKVSNLIERYGLRGTPTSGLWMGTWGFFIGFAAVSLYGPAAHYFQASMGISGVTLGLLVWSVARFGL